MNIQERATEVLARLTKKYPNVQCALNHSNVFELLVATILSAQCTDKRVNIVTETLFKKYRTPEDYATADLQEFEQDIRSTGFYRNKAKNIIAMAQKVVHNFNGTVPKTMDELLTLNGVARKTANVVLSVGYGTNIGFVVDTHVTRISNLLGLTKEKNPVKIERDLMKLVPQPEWDNLSLRFIEHGRETCIARRPQCDTCVLNDICPSAFTTTKKKR